jgi:hypothetical protein
MIAKRVTWCRLHIAFVFFIMGSNSMNLGKIEP